MARQIIQDHIARPQIGHEDVGDIGFEPFAVDRAIQESDSASMNERQLRRFGA